MWGDYYDFIPAGETRIGLAIADVSGKGIPAALIMAGFRMSLLAEIRNEFTIRAVLRRGVRAGKFRRGVDPVQLYISIAALGYFYLGNRHTLSAIFGSKSADEQGNSNFRGLKSRVVDALIDATNRANTLEELRDASRALDRVVMWNFYQIPDLYSGREPISYWNRFGIPKTMAHYFQADTYYGLVEHTPWPLYTWWDKGREGAAPVAAAGRA